MSRPGIEPGSQELASCTITTRPPKHDTTGPCHRAFDVFQGSCCTLGWMCVLIFTLLCWSGKQHNVWCARYCRRDVSAFMFARVEKSQHSSILFFHHFVCFLCPQWFEQKETNEKHRNPHSGLKKYAIKQRGIQGLLALPAVLSGHIYIYKTYSNVWPCVRPDGSPNYAMVLRWSNRRARDHRNHVAPRRKPIPASQRSQLTKTLLWTCKLFQNQTVFSQAFMCRSVGFRGSVG